MNALGFRMAVAMICCIARRDPKVQKSGQISANREYLVIGR